MQSIQSLFDRRSGLVLILLLAATLTACNLPTRSEPATPTDIPPVGDLDLLATLTQQAVEKMVETSTARPLPSETAILPETSTPTGAPSASAPIEIKFRPWGTSAYYKGEISPGQQLAYTFEAGGGQTLLAGVSSNDQDVYFEIKGLSNGSILIPFSERSSSLVTQLPVDGAYQITLTSETENTYFLSVEIPADISLAVGSGLNTVDGRVEVLEEFYPDVMTRVRYILDLEKGTIFDVQIQSDGIEYLSLALTGKEDGVPYLRYVVKSESINDFPVMVTQAYYLDVYSVSGESVDYQLEIEIGE